MEASSTIEPYTIGLAGVDTELDNVIRSVLLGTLGTLVIAVLLIRLQQLAKGHMRHLLAIHANKRQQTYFSRNDSTWWPWIKRHIIYAPLLRKRHNREIRLSSTISVGTVPTRFQAALLSLYVLSNLAYCITLDYNMANKYAILAELRGRSGVLAVANIVPLIILAGRNNPLIAMLQVSFDTYNLLHRWMGRTVVIESVIHTAAWMASQVASDQWDSVWAKMSAPYMLWGGVGVTAGVIMGILSPSAVRHAFYETFLTIHILLAIATAVGIYLHCSIGNLPPLPYVKVAVAFWIADRLFRFFRILQNSFSRRGWTDAEIVVLPGDACQVTVRLAGRIHIKPGTHAYLRFAQLNIWESHPFSIAWSEEYAIPPVSASDTAEKTEAIKEVDLRKPLTGTSVSFVIYAQAGLTRRLLNFAKAHKCGGLCIPTLFEGPYAGHHSLDSYGHTVLFAGSSGITFQIPYIRRLISGCEDGTVATRRIILIWVIREIEHLQWVDPWMTTLLRMTGQSGIFHPKIFVTKPKRGLENAGTSDSLQIFCGRPNIAQVLNEEVKQQVGAMCVTVCGPGGLADDVRSAVRNVQDLGSVDFIEESFSW
ncbi:ferric reductase like transmembrane component [Bisporella sp. PMI_857]|nr:ferric reductase like transmembrane component [Bisporella sp. PMI_857]